MKYYDLTFCPDVIVKTCDSVGNPADRVPLDYEGSPHRCVADSVIFSKLRPDLEGEPLCDAEVVYFVDGSSHHYDNKTQAGFSVVQMVRPGEYVTVMCIPCKQPCSAQLAELKALTEACSLAAGKRATVHTDSAYSHNVCHVYGAQWKQRGFKKSDGSPIQHQEQIQLLLTAMMRPERLAICKCKAHKKGGDYITLGNEKADENAKEDWDGLSYIKGNSAIDKDYEEFWDEIDERIYHLNDFVTQTIKQDCLEAGMDHLIKDIFERRDFYFN